MSVWGQLPLPPAILQLLEQMLHTLLKGVGQGFTFLIMEGGRPVAFYNRGTEGEGRPKTHPVPLTSVQACLFNTSNFKMLASSGSTIMAASVAESPPGNQHFTRAVHWSWDLPEALVTHTFFLPGLMPQ